MANSRVRWAMVIDREFAITNDPTNKAMPPNTRRKVRKKSRKPSGSGRVLGRLLVGGPHLGAFRQDLLDRVDQLLRGGAGLAGEQDLVQLAGLVEQPLRGRQLESGQGGATDRRHGAELDQSRDPHPLDRAASLDADRVTGRETLLLGGLGVDHDFVRSGPIAAHQREGVELRPVRVDAEAEVRRAAEDDRLAVAADQLGLTRDRAVGEIDLGQRGDLRQQALVERRRHAGCCRRSARTPASR